MRTKQQSSQRKVSCAGMLITLIVIILFSCSQEALAQQWTTTTSGNDIYNSNSGNVGVGTNSPGVKLDILSSVSLIARFGSSAGGHTQVLVDAPSAYNSNLTLQRGGISKWFMGNRASNDRLSFIESTGGVEVLTLLQNGNVGVGTSNPQDGFHLFNTTNNVGTMRLQGGNTNAAFLGVWDPGQMLLLTNNRHPGTGNNFNTGASGAQLSLWGPDIVFHATSSGPVGNGTELMRIKGGGQIGIGTATPGYRLDVQGGTINSSGGLCIAGDCKTAWSQVGGAGSSQWTNAASNIFFTTGNVGIGTPSPEARLDIAGGNLRVQSGTLDLNNQVRDDSINLGGGLYTLGIRPWTFYARTGQKFRFESGLGDSTQNAYEVGSTAGVTFIAVKNNGFVGIGTTTPNRRLELLQDVGGISFEAGTGSPNSGAIRFGDASGWKLHFGRSRDSIGGALNSGTSGVLMTIQDNGNIGIGTTGPNYKLDVNGEINATGLRINGTPISTGGPGGPVTWTQVDKSVSSLADITTRNASDLNLGTVPIGRIGLSGNAGVSTFLRGDNTWGPVPSSQWTSGTNNISYNAGSVGIGTASPGFLLDVSGSTNNPFRVRDSSGREYFSTTTRTGPFGTGPVVSIAGGRLIIDNNAPDGGNDTIVRRAVNSLVFKPSDHPDLPGAFMVLQAGGSSILYAGQNANGNVGIGTTTPGAKLEVVGNINVTGTGNITAAGTIEGGNIKAKYQDVAEWVESSQELPTGTLVVLDHTKSNQVIASSQAYDTRVAGVISERSGIALGEGGDNKVLVATTGRVRLKVDASNGPIQIGDLLVTSDIPGVAMKSEAINVGGVQIHRPGTLVGKALEPLAKGHGKILVLLSLQ